MGHYGTPQKERNEEVNTRRAMKKGLAAGRKWAHNVATVSQLRHVAEIVHERMSATTAQEVAFAVATAVPNQARSSMEFTSAFIRGATEVWHEMRAEEGETDLSRCRHPRLAAAWAVEGRGTLQ